MLSSGTRIGPSRIVSWLGDGSCGQSYECVETEGEGKGVTVYAKLIHREISESKGFEDYFLQGCAYANAHNVMFETDIQQIVILMVDRNLIFQEYIVRPTEFSYLTRKWKNRLIEFNKKYNT